MIKRLPIAPLAATTTTALFMMIAVEAALAQSQQQKVIGGTEQQAGDQQQGDEPGGGQNQYGWPNGYVAQVGAGVTNGATTGYSGPKDSASASPEPSLPDLPGASLCDAWKGTDVHPFCMEKLVR